MLLLIALIGQPSLTEAVRETAFIIWLAPWAGKMNQTQRYNWLPERARWRYHARSGLPAVPQGQFPQKSYNKSFTEQAYSVKMAEYWPLSPSVSVQKHAKELGQYPAILTEQVWSITAYTRHLLRIWALPRGRATKNESKNSFELFSSS